jgi:hypothetical protein
MVKKRKLQSRRRFSSVLPVENTAMETIFADDILLDNFLM